MSRTYHHPIKISKIRNEHLFSFNTCRCNIKRIKNQDVQVLKQPKTKQSIKLQNRAVRAPNPSFYRSETKAYYFSRSQM